MIRLGVAYKSSHIGRTGECCVASAQGSGPAPMGLVSSAHLDQLSIDRRRALSIGGATITALLDSGGGANASERGKVCRSGMEGK